MKSCRLNPRPILWIIALFAVVGVAFASWLSGTFAGRPDPRSWYSAFCVIFARDEILGLSLVALFSLVAIFFFNKSRSDKEESPNFRTTPLWLSVIAAGVFAITALGTHFVCHDYALSADEFMADFQAKIFLRGHVTAEVPPEWQGVIRVIKPTYVDYFPATHRWKAAYLPVYAAMRAVFQAAYLQSFLNPCLAAITLLALYGAVRNFWPDDKQNALVALLLLGSSAQFLLMAMTGYAMSAHLALNTVWLWLYSRPERRRFYLAPVVGVLAIGLHQPIVHALFVAPFLLRLVRERRWRAVSIFGLLYSLGCAGWYAWRSHYAPPAGAALMPFFRLWNPKMIVIQPMNLFLIIGWSALATPLLAVLGAAQVLRARPIVQDAALSCLLTFGFYCFFLYDQGHGWGYRYFHGTLSCLILVAVAGWDVLVSRCSRRTARDFVVAGVAGSLLLGLPLRCYQAESFIRPFALASQSMHRMSAQIVGLNPSAAWYAADLIRNDPFLEDRPVIVALVPFDAEQIKTLRHVGRGHFVSRDELKSWGLATVSQEPSWNDPFRLGMGP